MLLNTRRQNNEVSNSGHTILLIRSTNGSGLSLAQRGGEAKSGSYGGLTFPSSPFGIGGYSAKSSGTGELFLNDSVDWDFGTRDFQIEFFFRPTSASIDGGAYRNYGLSNRGDINTGSWVLDFRDDRRLLWSRANGFFLGYSQWATVNQLSLNTTYYVCMNRYDGLGRIYFGPAGGACNLEASWSDTANYQNGAFFRWSWNTGQGRVHADIQEYKITINGGNNRFIDFRCPNRIN